ncbi:hypothetical protein OkiPb00461_05330 [Escherichia coli]
MSQVQFSHNPLFCIDIIKTYKPDFTPRVAFILGSGLGALADQIENAVAISYEKLPGFPVSTVHGHAGELVLGHLQGVPVLAMVSMGIGITLIADSYAQMNWPGVIFRPLKQRIPADLYIVYETQQVTPAMVKLLAALTQ